MSDYILFITEGVKREPETLSFLKEIFFKNSEFKQLHYPYGSTIYSLSKHLKEDPDLELIPLLKELENKKAKNPEYKAPEYWNDFKDIPSEKFSQIFLFFDYDPQDKVADRFDLTEMVSQFGNETEKGKLFISYPMLEALLHFSSEEQFHSEKVNTLGCKTYKKTVSDVGKLNTWKDVCREFSEWQKINQMNIKKAISHIKPISRNEITHQIICDNYPSICTQENILSFQISSRKINNDEFLVLSAFPFFLLDYFKSERFSCLLGTCGCQAACTF